MFELYVGNILRVSIISDLSKLFIYLFLTQRKRRLDFDIEDLVLKYVSVTFCVTLLNLSGTPFLHL